MLALLYTELSLSSIYEDPYDGVFSILLGVDTELLAEFRF